MFVNYWPSEVVVFTSSNKTVATRKKPYEEAAVLHDLECGVILAVRKYPVVERLFAFLMESIISSDQAGPFGSDKINQER